MAKAAFWKSDWFLGVVISLLMLLAGRSDLLQSLERKVYDMGVQMAQRTPSDRIAIIAIDDYSIANLGRWPWPRDLHAKLTDLLGTAQPRLMANTIFFSEPQIDPGYGYVTRLIEMLNQGGDTAVAPTPEVEKILAFLAEAEVALNTDRKLAESYAQAGNVLLPLLFRLGEVQGRPDKELPPYVLSNRLAAIAAGPGDVLSATEVQMPVEQLGIQAKALGHLNASPDVDGAVRTEALVVRYFDQYYPSMALMIAARSLNLGPDDIKVQPGQEVRLGKLRVATDLTTQMNTFFYKDRDGRPAFQVDSFYDVLTGKIPASKYAGKIVLVGATASGVGATQVTPVSPNMAPVMIVAHAVSSILQEHFFITPAWGVWASLGIFLLMALYITLLLPRLSAGKGALLTLALLVALLGAHFR